MGDWFAILIFYDSAGVAEFSFSDPDKGPQDGIHRPFVGEVPSHIRGEQDKVRPLLKPLCAFAARPALELGEVVLWPQIVFHFSVIHLLHKPRTDAAS